MFEDLLAKAFKTVEITIGEKKYIVREMSGKEDGEYTDTLVKTINNKPVYDFKNAKLKLVALSLHHMDGKKVFNKADFGVVAKLPASLINRVFEIAVELNNLNEGETEKN